MLIKERKSKMKEQILEIILEEINKELIKLSNLEKNNYIEYQLKKRLTNSKKDDIAKRLIIYFFISKRTLNLNSEEKTEIEKMIRLEKHKELIESIWSNIDINFELEITHKIINQIKGSEIITKETTEWIWNNPEWGIR